MSNALVLESSKLEDHQLQKFAEKMTDLLKLSSVQAINSQIDSSIYKFIHKKLVVGGEKKRKYRSLASVVAEKFDSLESGIQKAARFDLGRDKEITRLMHMYGVDVRSAKPVTQQIDVKRHFDFINDNTFSEDKIGRMISGVSEINSPAISVTPKEIFATELYALNSRYGSYIAKADWWKDLIESWSPPEPAAALNKGLYFRVHQVKCVDETNPEWPGHDEIAAGGVSIDDSRDTTTKIAEFYVRGGFDDGESKIYTPPRIVKKFDIEGDDFPKSFAFILALAEKDSSGLSKFIDELYQAVKAEIGLILAAMGAAAGAAVGTAIGGSVGTAIAGPLGTVIGAVLGAILGALVGWLISILKDDIFPPQQTGVFLGSANDTFHGGSLVSPSMYLHYREHGGHYWVKYDWEIVR